MKVVFNYNAIDLISDYDLGLRRLAKSWNLHYVYNERVFREALQAHILALLNARVISLFNPIDEDWKIKLMDLIFPNQLDSEEHANRVVAQNQHFEYLTKLILGIIGEPLEKCDKQFTMWDVELDGVLLKIEALGDYRIEQWHIDYNVPKSIGETVTIDLIKLNCFVKKLLNYQGLPTSVNNVAKSKLFDSLIKNLVYYFINSDGNLLGSCEDILDNLVVNTTDIIDKVTTYFNIEYRSVIEKVMLQNSIDSVLVIGDSLYLYPNSRIVKSVKLVDRKELELKLAEHNQDYIPSKMR